MLLQNRREILFIYDVTRSNPNGDPDDGNRPRMDEQGYNLVTDLRLKRTIRDFWISQKDDNLRVLIRQQFKDDQKTVMSMRDIVSKELGITETKKLTRVELIRLVPEKYIDARTFGAAITLPGANVSITGPMQFGIGKSLNKPEVNTMVITTVLSAAGEQGAGSMGQSHYVDYSMILFHGIACEYNSEKTLFSEEDLTHLYNAMWFGTKQINTRSKFNHNPRLLLSVVSKEKEFQIGGLENKLKLSKEEDINGPEETNVCIDEFINTLKQYQDQIETIELKETNDLVLLYSDKEYNSMKTVLEENGFRVKDL